VSLCCCGPRPRPIDLGPLGDVQSTCESSCEFETTGGFPFLAHILEIFEWHPVTQYPWVCVPLWLQKSLHSINSSRFVQFSGGLRFEDWVGLPEVWPALPRVLENSKKPVGKVDKRKPYYDHNFTNINMDTHMVLGFDMVLCACLLLPFTSICTLL